MVLGSQPAASACPCRVVVKARPTPEGQEDALGHELTLGASDRLLLGREFAADRVYLPAAGDAVYEDEVEPLVSSLYEGFNSTIFAYGASGAGKTHTILGRKQQPGLVDRVVDGLFERYDQRSCAVAVSVEELYCERFTDLLAPKDTAGPARQPSAHFKLPRHQQTASSGAGQAARKYTSAKVAVGGAAELKALVQHTLRKRHTASTAINERSSRSHVVVTISLEQRKQVFGEAAQDAAEQPVGSAASEEGRPRSASDASSDSDECGSVSTRCAASTAATTYLIGKLHLVDLAGSENIKRSGAEGRQQKEAGVINKSLCHLKTVIEEVYKGSKVSTFRNSKLTYKLQDALGGGNSKLLVIACISTARACLGETKETLRFAEMARSITNKPVVNREPKDEIIHRLQQQLEEAEDELRKALRGSGALADQLLQQQLNAVEAAYADLQEEAEALEAARSNQLAAAHARESSLQQQLQAAVAEAQAERSRLQASNAASSKAAGLLQTASEEVVALEQQATQLQRQLEQQQVAADTAMRLGRDQQQVAAEQHRLLVSLQLQLKQERQARCAADARVQQLSEQVQGAASTMQAAQAGLRETALGDMQQVAAACGSLQAALQASALQHAAALELAASLQQQLQAAEAERCRMQQQLASAQRQVLQLQQKKRGAVQLLQLASGSTEEVAQQCQQLQQMLVQQQRLAAAASSGCSTCADGVQQLQQQLDEELESSAALRQQLVQQQEQAQLAQQAAAVAHARLSAHLQLERDIWSSSLDTTKASAAQLQQQLEQERHAHAAALAELQAQHGLQLQAERQAVEQREKEKKMEVVAAYREQLHSLREEAQDITACLLSQPGSAAAASGDSERCEGDPSLSVGDGDAGSSSSSSDGDADAGPAQDVDAQHSGRLDGVVLLQPLAAGAAAADAPPAALDGQAPQPQPQPQHSFRYSQQGDIDDEEEDDADSGVIGRSDGDATGFVGAAAGGGGAVSSPSNSSSSSDTSSSGALRLHMLPLLEAAGSAAGDLAAAAEGSDAGTAVADGLVADRESNTHGADSAAGVPCSPSSPPVAAAVPAAAGAGASWPQQYLPESAVDLVAAGQLFNRVFSGVMTVDSLKRFLKARTLGGRPHSMSLPGGARKRKHELVQDMTAWCDAFVALSPSTSPPGTRRSSRTSDCAAAAAGGGGLGGGGGSTGKVLMPRPLSSGGAGPLQAASGGNSSACVTPAKAAAAAADGETIDLCSPAAAAAGSAAAAATAVSGSPSIWQRLTPKSWHKASGRRSSSGGGAAGDAGRQRDVQRSPGGVQLMSAGTGQLVGQAAAAAAAGGQAGLWTDQGSRVAAGAVAEGVDSSSGLSSAVDLFLQQEGLHSPAVLLVNNAGGGGSVLRGAGRGSSGAASEHTLGWRARQVKASRHL